MTTSKNSASNTRHTLKQLVLSVVVFPMLMMLLIMSGELHAQTPTLNAKQTERPISAAEMTPLGYAAAAEMLRDSTHGLHMAIGEHLIMRRDSVVAAVDSMSRAWVSALTRSSEPHRIELFSMAELHVLAGQDAEAQRRIAAWLATPGLSARDRGWILGRSVELFLRWQHPDDPPPSPARIAIARGYLAQLEAMPRSTGAGFLFGALQNFMESYLTRGVVDTAIQYGMRAYTLPAQTDNYEDRINMAVSSTLPELALALSGQPGATRIIDSLITMLQGYMSAPVPADYAKLRWAAQFVASTQPGFARSVAFIRTIGKPAPAYIATHWVNQTPPTVTSDAAPGARQKPLDDGIIRVLAFGFFSCPHCQHAMRDWEKFQHRLPAKVECIFYDRSEGSWGGEPAAPDAEAEHLRHYYVDVKHYTYPIAIWAGPKDTNEEGGQVPRFSPTMGKYGFWGGPHLAIVDGHGLLRYVGGWSERDILRVVNLLVRERDHATSTVSAAPATLVTPQ